MAGEQGVCRYWGDNTGAGNVENTGNIDKTVSNKSSHSCAYNPIAQSNGSGFVLLVALSVYYLIRGRQLAMV
ncbi:hypothetical protein [uncultured Gammaproteobacteria bacterium]|nr:hypothetical protein [uncultured Gammaproteobacteria bacterium]